MAHTELTPDDIADRVNVIRDTLTATSKAKSEADKRDVERFADAVADLAEMLLVDFHALVKRR